MDVMRFYTVAIYERKFPKNTLLEKVSAIDCAFRTLEEAYEYIDVYLYSMKAKYTNILQSKMFRDYPDDFKDSEEYRIYEQFQSLKASGTSIHDENTYSRSENTYSRYVSVNTPKMTIRMCLCQIDVHQYRYEGEFHFIDQNPKKDEHEA